MRDRARRRQARDSVIAQYEPNPLGKFVSGDTVETGTQLGISFLTSLADPLNVAATQSALKTPFVGDHW